MTEIMALKEVLGKEGKYREHSITEAHSTSTVPSNVNPLLNKRGVFWASFAVAQVFGLTSVILMVIWIEKYLGGLKWSDKSLQFNYHPLFLTVGLVYLFGNGIAVYRVAPGFPKIYLKMIHGGHHILVIAFTIIGLVAIFEYKRSSAAMDMYSLHSWIGMITAILFALQYLLGLFGYMVPVTPMWFRERLLPFHRFFGIGIFAMSIGSVLTGMAQKLMWTKDYGNKQFTPTGIVGNCFGLFVIVFALIIGFLTTNAAFKRQPLPDELPSTHHRSAVN